MVKKAKLSTSSNANSIFFRSFVTVGNGPLKKLAYCMMMMMMMYYVGKMCMVRAKLSIGNAVPQSAHFAKFVWHSC